MKIRKITIVLMSLLLIASMTACSTTGSTSGSDPEETWGYMHITQEEAVHMMEEDPNAIILDVRTQEEYDEGHIPGAICIPNEAIGDQEPDGLPDLTQRILVYCRSGNRSKQAAQKLADMGYTNVHEFGGIIDWTGKIVTSEDDGSMANMKMDIDGTEVSVKWEDNAAVKELGELAANGSYQIKLSKYSDFEQVGPIGKTLTSDDKQMTTELGDIVLYQGNQIVIFYGSNSWSYTKLGHITDKSPEEMEQLLGNKDVIIHIHH